MNSPKPQLLTIKALIDLSKFFDGKLLRSSLVFPTPDVATLFAHVMATMTQNSKIVESWVLTKNKVKIVFTKSALKDYLKD